MGDLREASERVSVLVVGAGPTGLLLAAELHRRNVSCQIIDMQPGPLHWDRATVIHPRSLEMFESLGLVRQFLEAGTKQRTIKMYSHGQLLGALDLSECGSSYGFNVGLSEEVTESLLTEYLHACGGDVQRSSRLVGLRPHAGGVLAEIERNGSRYSVEAEWVVGCDGIHSPTRDLSGIVLEGHDIDKAWAVFDVTIAGWADSFEVNVAYLDQVPIILTALPGRRWRVYLRPSSAESDLVADAISTMRRYQPGASFVDVENPTRFHCHSKVANQFRSGRTLLAGDSAHLCSPIQGHGMNCGVQDAFNLAWKLALVCHGIADPALLDSYEAERRPVAEMVARSGDMTEESQMLTDPAARDSRDKTIKAMFAEVTSRRNEAVAEAELNVNYSASPIVFGDGGSILGTGQRLPNAIGVQPSGASRCRLHELAQRAGHTLVLLAGTRASASDLADLRAATQNVADGSSFFDAVVAAYLESSSADVLDGGNITLLAVRPDGYIGMRSDRDHLRSLEQYRALLAKPV